MVLCRFEAASLFGGLVTCPNTALTGKLFEFEERFYALSASKSI